MVDEPSADRDPEAELERAFMAEFLSTKGHTFETVHALPADRAAALLKQASSYASGKLTERESRARLLHELHGEAPPPTHVSKPLGPPSSDYE
jgi:hypothetical protein